MDLLTESLKMFSKCPLWAITPDSFAALLAEITSGSFYEAKQFQALKPQTLGKCLSNKVTVIPVQGALTKDCSWCGTTYGSITSAVEEAASDPKVKQVILAVDSPGGEVVGLPETASAIHELARLKPVRAMVEGMSASAAYYLTSQATDITLAPSAEVGSVGVRVMHADISKMLQDAGINITEMHAGQYKTEWSPFAPLTDEAKGEMQRRLDTVHGDFLKAVGQGRGNRVSADIAAARYGEGRMFFAVDAKGHGLVDAIQAPRDFYRSMTPVEDESSSQNGFPVHRARLDLEKARF